MNAKELMIGDWIYCTPTKKNIRVNQIFKTMITPEIEDDREHACIGDEYLAPIYLTKEIIEKNEWKCYNTYQMYSCSNVPFDLRAQKDGGFTVEVAADEYGSSTFMFIQYVHQFQHLLKLVGYEKEIIL